MRAQGASPSSSQAARVPSSTAAAPSLIGDELPAVIVPSRLKAGFSFARLSTVVSGRIDSSRRTPSTSSTQSSCRPASQAALRQRVAARRVGVHLLARDAGARRHLLGGAAERRRPLVLHPRVHHAPADDGLVQLHAARRAASSERGITYGARLIDSTPPATTSRASPTASARAPWIIASEPDAQRRLTVTPGHGRREPREQHRHAGDVAVLLAGAVRVAEDHVVDRGVLDPGLPVEQRADDGGREVVGADVGDAAAVAPEGRAHGVQDVGVHQRMPPSTGTSCPVMPDERSLARKSAVVATSSSVTIRPSALRAAGLRRSPPRP